MSIDKIMKFGGSSVGTPERIQCVMDIILKSYNPTAPLAVVVSAFGGVTDQLLELSRMAARGKNEYRKLLDELIQRHKDCANILIPKKNHVEALKTMEEFLLKLQNVVEGVFRIRELSPKTADHIMSFGERLSALILTEAIRPKAKEVEYLDAREFIKTDNGFGIARVDFEQSNKLIQRHFKNSTKLSIITGFIAADEEGETTTLGRGGSDYTASILGAALNAKIIEIWTDVNGVMTADPKKEPYAFTIPQMSYKEAMELSYFGAKVIHPPTIIPALNKNIPLLIKNSFHAEEKGTLISSASSKTENLICGISSIDQTTLLSIQGSGMVGVCGIAKRLFGALAEKGINIILISQGSSEQSICVAISPTFAELAKSAIEKEFALEIQTHLIDKVILEHSLSVIAVVGENMSKTSGIAAKLFSALGKNGINVNAITQGSSDLNITVVVDKEDEGKSIRAIHEAFFLSPIKTLNLFCVGTGLIGKALLQQMEQQVEELHNEYSLDIRLIGLANSQRMIFEPKGIPLKTWRRVLGQESTQEAEGGDLLKTDLEAFIKQMNQLNLINSIFVDCTSHQGIADSYTDILNANVSIVTPNKKANSGSYATFKKLRELSTRKGAKFSYGSNVGAGLPIISTINELIRGGDKVLRMEAILSGTLSFLFNSFNEKKPFSDLVLEAQKKGFTEPDPRDDLNGMDVARKLLILARECKYVVEMKDIAIEHFLPEDCFKAPSLEEFYKKLKKFDEKLEAKRKEAIKEKKLLRHIATFENGKGTVRLEAIGMEHPFYHLSANDNIIAIRSEFYKQNPLVIKGQGAGANVTAGKVFADIIRLGLDHNSH